MSIHRDLEQLQEQFSDLKNSLILNVFGRVKADQFSQFQDWAEDCMACRPEAQEKLERLLSFRVQ